MSGVRLQDHLGRELVLEGAPARIVSLVPSITESLVALGARDRLAGRTEFCIHPAAELALVPTVGGTKTPDLARIRALAPDLVLANKEENREVHVLDLARDLPVFVTDVRTLAGARAWLLELAALLEGRQPGSHEGAEVPAPRPARPRAAALVWRAPLVGVGEDTYAADVLASAGLANVFGAEAGRYPRLASTAELAALAPEVLVLPSEPYPWTREEGLDLERELLALGARARSVRVPGESMTWWGTRTARAATELWEAIR